MIVIRNCFVAKPGHASKLAAQLKEAAANLKAILEAASHFGGEEVIELQGM